MAELRNYFLGILVGVLALGAPFWLADILLSRVGEIGLEKIVRTQLLDGAGMILYSSGLNQNAFSYKLKLMDAVKPEVIAVGSSRAMPVRAEYFNRPFVNLSRSVSSIGDLELLVDQLEIRKNQPEVALLFVDPWWFNSQYAKKNVGDPRLLQFPEFVSLDLLVNSAKAMSKGNWIKKSAVSKNLGIHAILTGDGFAKDGSYHYVSALKGKGVDIKFSHTLSRVKAGAERFGKADRADAALVGRACVVISRLKRVVNKLVLIAPPFSAGVWNAMAQGGYGYIEDAHRRLRACVGAESFFDFSSPATIPGSTDCEFTDGFHGGDVTYARMLKLVSNSLPEVKVAVSRDFVDEFIRNNEGFAGGMTRMKFLGGEEVDFNGLGCLKREKAT